MEEENQTGGVYFHFQPFSTDPAVVPLIFVALLLLYLGSLIPLHTPMDFLFVLAMLEVGYSTNIMLISLPTCGAQMLFFILLGGSDGVLLAVMAYDSYAATCPPLHYSLIMSQQLCGQMTSGSLGLGFLLSLPLTILICHLPFCGPNEIYHFFCDMPAVTRLACADMHVHKTALYVLGVAAVAIPFLLICLSYGCIVAAILRMNSICPAEGRHKAFSACSSHLTVVVLQYGCRSLIYPCPSSRYSPDRGQGVSAVYTFITPVLNPLVYSMRNELFKDALKKEIIRLWRFRAH
uniref:G-protein coupled receptors family 1 profile domain-containing protein n=1 Tax=Ailuropoda melanoleuca TaxID=9646 RepID=A0A7N5P8C4_AILME